MKYRSRDGDVLDQICYQHYGKNTNMLEQVLESNPGLAQHGSIFSAGLIIDLPPAPEIITVRKTIRLWD